VGKVKKRGFRRFAWVSCVAAGYPWQGLETPQNGQKARRGVAWRRSGAALCRAWRRGFLYMNQALTRGLRYFSTRETQKKCFTALKKRLFFDPHHPRFLEKKMKV